MKYLGVFFIFCVGVTVNAVPIFEDNELEINVTVIPINETTTSGAVTIHPATDQTISAATMPPATDKTDTAPTIGPMTTGSPLPVSLITIEPTTAATIVPITTQSNPTPAPKTGGFDGGSFGGGIALGFGLCIIFVVAYVVYSRRNSKGYNTMYSLRNSDYAMNTLLAYFRNWNNGCCRPDNASGNQTTMHTTEPSMTNITTVNYTTETMTTMESTNVTAEFTTGNTGTGSTQPPMTTQVHTTQTKTTAAPQPTPKPKHGFDGGSFGGGIALGLGLAAIILITYRCYIMRHKSKGYGDVN